MFSVGVDIVKNQRMTTMLKMYGEKFINRIFGAEEIAKMQKYHTLELQAKHLAKRFAAKEAYVKAIKGNTLHAFKSIQLLNDQNGCPYFTINNIKQDNISVSVSDEDEYSIAFVMINNINFSQRIKSQ